MRTIYGEVSLTLSNVCSQMSRLSRAKIVRVLSRSSRLREEIRASLSVPVLDGFFDASGSNKFYIILIHEL